MQGRRWLYTTALCNAALMGQASEVLANPMGGEVAAGKADIKNISQQKLEIHQHTDKAVIDWRSFDIDQGQHTEFKQPSKTSHTLNRVNSNDPSQILGKLSANGKVTLINPNGVFFGKSAQVDVNGLIATTADIKNADFMAGKHNFTKASNNPDAKIINEGLITAKEAGLVGLVAPHVENHGIIQAKTVQMASGDLALDLHGDGLLHIAASDAIKQQIVANTGLIVAAETDASGTVTGGGTIAITAAAARDAVNSLIVIEGELHAPVINQTGGKIIIANASKDIATTQDNKVIATNGIIQAGSIDILNTDKAGQANGVVAVSGIIKAEYPTPLPSPKPQTLSPTKGGTIRISAKTTMVNNAVLDVSGTDGGGNLRLGGEYLGSTTEVPLPGKFVKNLKTPNAETTIVGENTLLIADAHARGDGGNMVTWADGDTYFYGSIFARGGTEYGNGGFVEVSGKGYLDMQANTVDLTPQHSSGKKGTLLLDPTDIVISNFAPNDASIAANLQLWLDASDASTVTLAYDTSGLGSATASGTSGSNTITTSSNVSANLAVGARIRLTAAGTTTTADALGSDTYTIASISCTTTCTINTVENLTSTYSAQTLYRGLVSQWNNKSGNLNNASAGGIGRPLWIAANGGQNGNAELKFDGVDDWININDSITNGNSNISAITVSKVNTLKHSYVIGSNFDSRFYINLDTTDFRHSIGNVNGITTYTANTNYNIRSFKAIPGNITTDLNGFKKFSNLNYTTQSTLNGLNIGSYNNGAEQFLNGIVAETILFNTRISDTASDLLNQYQSSKYNIALTAPGTGATEAAKAMAANGYSVFHKGYLERLSQTADIALVADNSITINDLTANGGDGVLALSAGRNLSMTTTTGNITMLNTANTLRTNGGTITASAGGSLTLGNLDTTGNGATATGAAISLTGSSLTLGGNIQTGTSGSLLASSTTGNLTTTAALNGLQGAALFKSNNNLTISGGDITTSTGSNALTFLAQGDITFLSSVQHGGSGNVNVVAGWDGTTEASATPATFNMANILAQPVATTTIYGQDNDGAGGNTGSVFVNTASGVQGVAVGSRYGLTNIVGNNIAAKGGNSTNEHAQIGYRANLNNTVAHITVLAKNDISLLSGTANRTYTQIGHGGELQSANFDGNITVSAANNITLAPGFVWNDNYSMIGHGGRISNGSKTGNISIDAVDLSLIAGDEWNQFALIGHGGTQGNQGNTSGNININVTNLTMTAGANGSGNYQLAQIGHGNYGNFSGNIVVNVINNALLKTISNTSQGYTLIGHGAGGGLPDAGTRTGNIQVSVGGELSLISFDNNNRSEIGHITTTANGVSNSNVRILANSLDFADDTPDPNSFNINNTDFISRLQSNLAAGSVTLLSTGSDIIWSNPFSTTNTNALTIGSVGNVTLNDTFNSAGKINVFAGWDSSTGLDNADASFNLATARLAAAGAGKDLILGASGALTSSATGNSILLAAANNFINNNTAAASSVLSTPNGRYLIYASNNTGSILNNLTPTAQNNIAYGDDVSAYTTGNYIFYRDPVTGTIRLIPLNQTYTYNGNSQFVSLFGTAYGINSSDVSTLTTDGYSTTDFNNSLSAGLGFAIDSIALGSADTTNAFSASKDITLTGSLTSSLGYTVSLDNSVVGDYLINPKAITAITGITANNKVYDGLTTAGLNVGSASFTGIIGGDSLSVASSSGNFDNKNAGTGKTVAISGLSLGGIDARNYTLADATASSTADITPAALAITASANQRKVYGDAEPASYGYSLTSGNLFGSDTFSGALARVSGENAGLYAINQGSVTAGSNYTLSYNSADFEISKALLTLTPTAQSYTYNASNNQFNNTAYTLSGFKFSDTASVVSGSALVSASDKINAGTRDITASTGTLNASNYTFIANTLNNGLGIAKADLTIDVNDASRQVGQANPNFTYLVTGLKGNDTESVINNLNLATPASLNSPAGSYAITAKDATARNYSFVYNDGRLTLLPVAIPDRPISSSFKLPDTVAQVSQGVTQGLANNLATAQRNILNNTNFRTAPYTAASVINNTAAATIIPILDTTLPTESSVFSNQGIYLTMHPDLANILGYKGDSVRY